MTTMQQDKIVKLHDIRVKKLFSDRGKRGGGPRGVMVKTLDGRIVVSEFELQSRYYVRFLTKTLGKGMDHFILLAIG